MKNLTGQRAAFPTPDNAQSGMSNRFYVALQAFIILLKSEPNARTAAIRAFECADVFNEVYEKFEREND
jgi:hypothetical protein